MSFPLYDNLCDMSTTQTNDLLAEDKEKLIRSIKKLDIKGHEIIYALIKVYKIKNEENVSSFTIPYDGKHMKSGIKFDLDLLPLQLKYIIQKFVTLHESKMIEDENR